MYEVFDLKRDCEAIEIPSGTPRVLPAGFRGIISQFLGTGYTITSEMGYIFRVEARDADALGLTPPAEDTSASAATFSEEMVWDQLKTVYDPEIPVNVVDLGLIYSCDVKDLNEGGKKIDVRMTMTAPGCGMSNVLKSDVEGKLGRIPEVKAVNVEVVFDPPWNPGLMSQAAKLQLGFDL